MVGGGERASRDRDVRSVEKGNSAEDEQPADQKPTHIAGPATGHRGTPGHFTNAALFRKFWGTAGTIIASSPVCVTGESADSSNIAIRILSLLDATRRALQCPTPPRRPHSEKSADSFPCRLLRVSRC